MLLQVVLSLAMLVVGFIAEDCFNYDELLKKTIKDCEDCKKEFNETDAVVSCYFYKSGMITEAGNITVDTFVDGTLDGFAAGDVKREIVKKDLIACLKDGKIPQASAHHEVDKCKDETLIKHCPEVKEKLKEFRGNEIIRTCDGS